MAALVREKSGGSTVQSKVSLRSTDGGMDVAALAQKRGGGGHARAAGFTSDEDVASRRSLDREPSRGEFVTPAGVVTRWLRAWSWWTSRSGPTSFDMVRTARRGLKARVGHAGTLDPFASGLLLVMVGQATRISNLLMGLPKEYDVTVQFGAVSTTADPTGDITLTGRRTSEEQVAAALDGFRGPHSAAGAADLGGQGRRRAVSTRRRIEARRPILPNAK